jgi:NAD+ kinase
VELDRQHLANVDLMLAVGGDGTVLSSAHFLDNGTIPLLGVNSDPIQDSDRDTKKNTDERRSHGALCMCTADNMADQLVKVLYGEGTIMERTRIQCVVKSTFSETRLVPALNDILIANPSPAAVSRFRMGFLVPVDLSDRLGLVDGNVPKSSIGKGIIGGSSLEERETMPYKKYGTVTRFGGVAYDIRDSLNVWSSGLWISTATGATAAMAAAGGKPMDLSSKDIQYYIREHIREHGTETSPEADNGFVKDGEQLHLRWNSQKGNIFIDGSHLTHPLELGDEILINSDAPPLQLFVDGDKVKVKP